MAKKYFTTEELFGTAPNVIVSGSGDGSLELPRFNHISQEDFFKLSEEGYGLFGKGREEFIVP